VTDKSRQSFVFTDEAKALLAALIHVPRDEFDVFAGQGPWSEIEGAFEPAVYLSANS
jgi:hypothetical protein